MAAATAGVVWVLYQREFHSAVLSALDASTWGAAAMPPPRPPAP
jgi:uncharacterized membrane protein